MAEVLKPELLEPVARAFARRVADHHLQETPSGGDVQMSEEKFIDILTAVYMTGAGDQAVPASEADKYAKDQHASVKDASAKRSRRLSE
jgi:hypothetical protein